MKSPNRLFLPLLAAAHLSTSAAPAGPVISEILASNEAAGYDKDGDASDWLELYNPGAAPADLSGWHLTDDALDVRKWTFPAGTVLPAGGFLRVWASGKDRGQNAAELHTNFSLSASGEYLALVSPEGTPVSQFQPAFPAMERDESHGLPFESTPLIVAGTPASVRVPADDADGLTWTQPGYNPGAGWTSGGGPYGFGVSAPGFYIEERASSGSITSVSIAEQVLNGTNAVSRLEALMPVVNFTSAGYNDGHFDNGVTALHGDADNYARRATARLIIPETGKYTFHVRSDDGFVLRLGSSAISQFSSTRNPGDSFVTRDLTAGEQTLSLTYFANTGDDEVELSAAKVTATTTVMTDAFRLIGDTANGGLAVLAPANPLLPQPATDLETRMKGINASVQLRVPFTVADPGAVESLVLHLAASDGFVAYLNGVEVARSLAPENLSYNSAATGTRPALEAIRPVNHNISAARSLLRAGENVLALHGLNNEVNDGTFLLAPSLTAHRRIPSAAPLFFSTPTPGAANPATGILGHVQAPFFMPQRGFYQAPAEVTLSSTPGAVIRYSLDGSTPTATTGTVYTGPLTVDKTTVVRAAAFLEGYASSADVTHTYLFPENIIRQPSTAPGPGWPAPGTVNGQRMDYAMDQRIVNHTNPALGGADSVKSALTALPTLCITTDLPNLFHPTTGIYNHATNRGRDWERRASLELIAAAGRPETGFQVNFGVRMRGGYSRSGDNPKHSFRAFFRREYGAGKLNYPVFPDDPTAVTEFDKFDIQCSQNYSWSYGTQDINASHNALRELWNRDSQLDFGQPSTRGRFVQLYLNGVYWGLYQIQERAEAAWAASYLGGSSEDYDIVKNDRAGAIEATDGYYLTMPDGSDAAWKKMWAASRESYFINSNRAPSSPYGSRPSTLEEKLAAYFRLQGLQADGRTPSGGPALLDIDNLIDYYILIAFARNSDSGLSLGGQSPNNFYTARSRVGSFGFISVSHDGEHSMDAPNAADRWGPFDSATGSYWNNIASSNPIYLHQDMFASAEYRLRFADRIRRYFYNGGAMTTEATKARLSRRAAEIEQAIIAESARWGDSTISTPRTAANWRSARDQTLRFLDTRSAAYLSEARSRGYYPSVEPAVFNQRGGEVAAGFAVTLTNPNPAGGIVYYTVDGSDPRPVGGGFATQPLVPEFSAASWLVPSVANGGSTLTAAQWTGVAAPPNAAAWSAAPMGYGFNPAGRPATTNFSPFIKTGLQSAMQPEGGTSNGSLYVRVPLVLTAEQIAAMRALRLRVRYDDAYIAWLNGTEIARKNVSTALVPQWNTVSGTSRADASAILQDEAAVSGYASLLVPGENVFAFQVINQTADGTDLLFSPEIVADIQSGFNAMEYTGPVTVQSPVTIRTRVLSGTVWSALDEAYFTTPPVPASAGNLVVSELHYAPSGPQTEAEAGYEGKDFEFIELMNIGTQPVDLNGSSFTAGVTFTFAGTAPVPPGGRVLLVSDAQAFVRRYGPGLPVLGTFSGSLNNAGETLRITAADGVTSIKEFLYLPDAPWPEAARGSGPSLVLTGPTGNPPHGEAASWKASALPHGTPGRAEPAPSGYAEWKAGQGGLADDADPDGDGLSVLLEYALGGTTAGNDRPRLPAAGLETLTVDGVAGNYLVFSYTRPVARGEELDYTVEASSTLDAGSWSRVPAVLVSRTPEGDAVSETLVYRSLEPATAGETLFLRLRIALAE